ncbi:MAG: hypothetical protein A3C58_01790 [Candidatus Staskawiczbacteria bacterium RIFCSPHIGHO2_02_FULL_34_10]|uniref:Uncharacterized protein n=2 Tax=Candidatus Staskawicziibacteriota TaxID=1817916 RepID=A0A1G2HL20_9BACT|nr:MAG: hypothetical protein A2639_03075 [Candidatus Staskawiczbacteria bacterium RIFCSPHIGHO2_01_FULL_34_27]OGZ67708.1 MAG: hypothetical protein A3C58_01790 [Candidatus Staskawiczbacteria bacterium RIFCSPHIGHO2_02_FULL_34_10]
MPKNIAQKVSIENGSRENSIPDWVKERAVLDAEAEALKDNFKRGRKAKKMPEIPVDEPKKEQ